MQAQPIDNIAGNMKLASNLLSDSNIIRFGFTLVIALQIHLIFMQGINWDEFLYLGRVYELQAGTMHLVVQTIHTRLFAWLPLVSGDEIGQMRTARFIMLGCELVTAACIASIAARFTSQKAGALMALAYLGGGFIFYHGTSFRADPIAAALLMSATWLMFRERISLPIIAGFAVLISLSAMVTVKSAFYTPVFIGIGLMRIAQADNWKVMMFRLGVAGALAIVSFVVLYLLHDGFLPSADMSNDTAMLGSALDTTIETQLFPRLDFILGQMIIAPILTILIGAGLVVLISRKHIGKKGAYFALIGLALPILTLVFYRNAFAYYFAFILPPILVASSVGLVPIMKRYGTKAVVALLIANVVWLYWDVPKTVQADQKQVIEAVHEIFPEPVPYIDRSSMISSYPKQGFFMSSWGMNRYLQRGEPVFAQILQGEKPQFVIANHSALEAALKGSSYEGPSLLAADAEVLRSNFSHHWGPIWVSNDLKKTGDLKLPNQSAPNGPIFLDFFH